jgi:hypothetical protein
MPSEALVLQRIISELSPLPKDVQQKLIDTVSTFFGLLTAVATGPRSANSSGDRATGRSFHFSEDDALSVKQFMHEKAPQTDVERVACLAYYLAHYRSTPHVKTKDITALNTESAHRPFSNTAVAVDNATKQGYLVPSIKGSKQISAHGERYVEQLPDREAAKELMDRGRLGRGMKPGKKAYTSAGAA